MSAKASDLSYHAEQDGQHISHIDAVTKIARDIALDLMSRDLLGFLLSATHMRKYICAYTGYACEKDASVLRRMLANQSAIDQFHHSLLKMYKSLHIAESRIKNPVDLLDALNLKFARFANEVGHVQEDQYCAQIPNLHSVELAYRYLAACSSPLK